MAEVIKVQVRAETRSAEDALKRAQILADALGKKQTTININTNSVDGVVKKLRVVQNEAAKIKMDSGVFNAYINGAISLEDALRGVQGETKKTSSVFSTITQRFTVANLASAAITAGISKLRQSLREAVSDMKEMNKELTTIKMVTGASDSDIANLRSRAFSGAIANGRTVTDYLTASERFARAGYRSNIEDLTQLSLTTQNVGGVTEDVASKFILAADAAWKFGGSTEALTTVLDGMTAISDQNATDIGKLAEGMTVAASAFANAGESAKTYSALVGTVTAATQRSGSEVARGLQTILFRTRQVKGELDDGEIISAADISNAAKALDSVGISVLNDAKELKSFSEIMGELSGKWDTLNTKQKAYLQNALAGNRRGNILFALMDNYDVYMKQIEQYENSAGSAAQKNAIYTESWAASTNNLKTAWAEVVDAATASGGILQKTTQWLADFLHESVQIKEYVAAGTADDEFAANMALYGVDVKAKAVEKLATALEAAKAQSNQLSEATVNVIKTYADEAEAVEKLAEAFEQANSNIKTATENMKSEKDDALKSVADIYKAMNEAAEKGYYGSTAFTEGAKLIFGTSNRDEISQTAKEAAEAYFKGIAEGDYSGAAATLWGNFADEQGNVVDNNGDIIASMQDLGDSYQWAFDVGEQGIGNFLQSMQDATGLSSDFWASLIESLGMYSDEMDEWMKENSEPEVEYTITVDDEQAKGAVSEIQSMLDSIQDKNVKLTVTTAINGANVGAAYGGTKATYDGMKLTEYYKSRGYGRAGGKHDNYSGVALVNDEFPADGSKPELIISKSQGGAYIANGGKPALVNLRSDDVVLTAKETQSALGGIPTFKDGKDIGTITTPKSTGTSASTTQAAAAEAKTDSTDNWNQLKKLIDYMVDQQKDILDDKLDVLDKQLEELEAARKQQQTEDELAEKQLKVNEALFDLQKAQVERTVRYYNESTHQWEWMADEGALAKAEDAYAKALKDLNDFLADLDFEEQKAAIQAQKDALQEAFDAYKEGWDLIIESIEAPTGDLAALFADLKVNGTEAMKSQADNIEALLAALETGFFTGIEDVTSTTGGAIAGTTAASASGIGGVTGAALSGIESVVGKANSFLEAVKATQTKNEPTSAEKSASSGGGSGASGGAGSTGSGGGKEVVLSTSTASTTTKKNAVTTGGLKNNVVALGRLQDVDPGILKLAGTTKNSTVNNNGGNTYMNGVRIGNDQLDSPLRSVLRGLSIMKTNN